MCNWCKVRVKRISALCAFAIVFIITLQVKAGFNKPIEDNGPISITVDTPPPIKKNIITKDSLTKIKISSDTVQPKLDTTQKDSLINTVDSLNFKMSKDSLDAPVFYEASDSGVLIIPTKEFILYGKAKAKYTDIEVTANTIELNQETQMLKAYGSTDTTGNPLNKPKLVQGETTSISDSIFYNTKTQKGLTKSSYLQEGEMFVYAQKVKKVNENTLYAYKGRFTTCNLDTPHFAFRTRKMKIINNKMAVAGATSAEFESVPIPIGIPFGIFPLNRGRHSGLLPPQFANNAQFGIGFEGLGYYEVLSDHIDLTARTNIYSYGGWLVNLNSRYLKRYKYNGNINISIQNTKFLNSDGAKTEFTTSRNYLLNWSHSRDTKARPGSNFSANVNFGSTQFNRFVANNPVQNFQNSLNSSINYSRDWHGKSNLSLNVNHSQNNNTRLVSLSLPNATYNVVTLYPFQKKESAGTPKWYEKLGIGYSGNFMNRVDFYDSAFSLKKILDTAQYGATHSLPITLSLPPIGPVQVGPSISYEENWYGQKVLLNWNKEKNKVDTSISRGIFTARQMAFGISANTRIFGTVQFKKTKKIQAIRHEIRPNISVNYRPDMNRRYYYNVQTDSTGKNFYRLSQFQGSIVSPFGEGRFGGIGFGVDNTLEMKVKNTKDTSEGGTKKVRILDGFGFNGSYNLFPSKFDSFPLSTLNVYARSNLFEKINITATATVDPYQINEIGVRRPKVNLPGRFTNGSLAISTSLQSKSKDGKKDKDRIIKDDYLTPDEQQRQLEYVRSNPAEFTDFNIPWTVSLSYSLNFSRRLNEAFKFVTQTFSNVSVNGDFSLTPRWKMGGNSYYDFTTKKIQTLTMFVTREMHCWQMSINITPVGLYRSFSITINPKSGILRDLKINRSRFFYQ